MTCMPETHPCPCTLISVLRSGWFDSCDMALRGISTLMPANFSRVPESVRAGGPASVSPLPSSFKKQKTAWNFPRKCSSKKRKKTDAWAAQARKEVAPQPRGHLTTRRQLPTASTNAYRHAGDSCIAGTLVFRGRLLEFSPSTLRRSGAGGREGALSAR